jgi:hypothetical protein
MLMVIVAQHTSKVLSIPTGQKHSMQVASFFRETLNGALNDVNYYL